jgi:putative inorganic carbon (HCO3(-)) transporter
VRAVAAAPPVAMRDLYSLRPMALWAFMRSQPASFWFCCVYIFFEYVRPQQIYPILQTVPWPQIVLGGALITWFIEGASVRTPGLLNAVMGTYAAIILLSCFTAQYPATSWEQFTIILNWFLLYLIVGGSVSSEARFLVFFVLYLLWSIKMSQHATRIWAMRGFGFSGWGATGAPGWFQNSGELGIQMCVFFPIATWFVIGIRSYLSKKWSLIAWAIPVSGISAAIGSSSRGALIGLGGVGLWMLLQFRKVRAAVILVTLTVLAWYMVPEESKTRFSNMGDDSTSTSRLTYWKDGIQITRENPITGVGYYNWMPYYREHYGGKQLPHNFLVQGAAELGFPGIIVIFGMIGATFLVNARVRRQLKPLGLRGHFLHSMAYGLDGAMVGFFVSGFFVSVLYYPFLYFNVAATASLALAARQLALEREPSSPTPVAVSGRRADGWRSNRVISPVTAPPVARRAGAQFAHQPPRDRTR